MQDVTIKTIDDVDIAGLLWERGDSNADAPQAKKKNLLLLHMMPEAKESWVDLAEEAYTRGYNVLAIDFRGHGQSGGGDYTKFTAEDHQKYFIDARAAMNFLEDKYLESKTFLIGASIGANIALQILSHDPLVEKVVALSAGTDYHGVRAIDFVAGLDGRRSVLLIASKDDVRKTGSDTAQMANELAKVCKGKCETVIYEKGGHGTDMLKTHPQLLTKILDFFEK